MTTVPDQPFCGVMPIEQTADDGLIYSAADNAVIWLRDVESSCGMK